MAEIKLRDIQLTYDGRTLTISSVKERGKSVTLDARTVEELVDFVKLFEPIEENRTETGNSETGNDETGNRREAFRVPVIDDFNLRCVITRHGECIEAKATNISMTGVFVELPELIELPERGSDRIMIDDKMDVSITLDKWNVVLASVVRRQEDHGFGLFFPATIRGHNVEPPPMLRRIVMDLQRRWMQHLRDS